MNITDVEGVGIARSVYRRAAVWAAEVRIPTRTRFFTLFQNVQTVTGAHPASYPIGTVG
jgi:hypothetical protein